METRRLADEFQLLRSAQARYAARAARACGYAFQSLDGLDGYLFEVSDGARRAVFAAGSGSPYAVNDVRAASIARDKAFCAVVLQRAGVPALPGRMFFVTKRWAEMRGPGREPEDALAWAETARFPIFCKPISASNGLFAEVIRDREAFAAYLKRVSREHFAILAQPFVRAPEHRVFVLDGRPVFSYRKQLPEAVGDGVTPLSMLLAAITTETGAPPLRARARNEAGEIVAPDSVLGRGEHVTLEGPANRAAGGRAADLSNGAPGPLAEVALAAAHAVGLRLAGVDIFDLSPQRDFSRLAVIEVNSNPMIATLEDHDRWDLIVEIWRTNIEAALR
jgi:cyanophycin synthetase